MTRLFARAVSDSRYHLVTHGRGAHLERLACTRQFTTTDSPCARDTADPPEPLCEACRGIVAGGRGTPTPTP